MPTIYGYIDLVKNELRNAAVQNLGSAPASPVKGQLYFDTTANILYWYNGTAWIAAQSGASLNPATTVTTQAIGDAPVVGTLVTYAREDHKHGQPAFGAPTAQTVFGAASATGSAATLPHSDHTHGTPTHLNADHAAINHSALAPPTADVSWGGFKLTNLGTPVAATDASTKGYVDAAINGLAWKDAARVASTANIVVATGGLIAVDGVTVAAGDRVLVKNQTAGAENGLYVAAAGAWTRASDAAAANDILNAAVFVSEGTTQSDTAWVMTTNLPITIGTTALTWTQFGGPGAYSAGNGLTLTGNVFAVGAGTGIVVSAGSTAVDTTVIATQAYVNTAVTGMAKKFAAALTGTASPETITHNLNTRDIQVAVYNGATPYAAVQVDWAAASVNTVTITYSPNLGAGYRVVVVG